MFLAVRSDFLSDLRHLIVSHQSLSDTVTKVKGIPCHCQIDDNLEVNDELLIPGQRKVDYHMVITSLAISEFSGSLAVEL